MTPRTVSQVATPAAAAPAAANAHRPGCGAADNVECRHGWIALQGRASGSGTVAARAPAEPRTDISRLTQDRRVLTASPAASAANTSRAAGTGRTSEGIGGTSPAPGAADADQKIGVNRLRLTSLGQGQQEG